jgi:hypothetical protein
LRNIQRNVAHIDGMRCDVKLLHPEARATIYDCSRHESSFALCSTKT